MLFATALISVTFFGDGALESFLSTYLRTTLAGGVLLSGFGIGSYHFASLLGRLTATAALRRFGERRVVWPRGCSRPPGYSPPSPRRPRPQPSAGCSWSDSPSPRSSPPRCRWPGHSAPGRSGQAVATTTAAGYGAFILSPLSIGLLAQATSLRLALALLILTSLAIAGLATRWPTASAIPPGSAPPVVGDRGSIYHHSTK